MGGGLAVVVNVMNQHLDCVDIQIWGTCEFANATSELTPDYETVMSNAKAIHAIVEAMKQHPKVKAIQHNGIGALGNSCRNNLANLANVTLLVTELVGVPLIVSAIEHFQSDEAFMEMSLRLLACLLDYENGPGLGIYTNDTVNALADIKIDPFISRKINCLIEDVMRNIFGPNPQM